MSKLKTGNLVAIGGLLYEITTLDETDVGISEVARAPAVNREIKERFAVLPEFLQHYAESGFKTHTSSMTRVVFDRLVAAGHVVRVDCSAAQWLEGKV
jgi:hypothetical protein